MKDNTNPPFYIGQKVVALQDGSNGFGNGFKKGDTFNILDMYLCQCGAWKVHVGMVNNKCNINACCRCGHAVDNKIVWVAYSLFAPIQTERIRYIAVCEELKNVPQVAETVDQ